LLCHDIGVMTDSKRKTFGCQTVILLALSAGATILLSHRAPLAAAIACWVGLALPFIYVLYNRKQIKRIWLLGPASLLILFCGLELGLRIGPFETRFLPNAVGKDFVPHPYMFWMQKPKNGHTADAKLSPHDGIFNEPKELEFRSGPARVEKPKGVFRIVTMGGSNAWGWGVPYEKSFTAHLEKLVAETYPGRKFDFIAAGAQAFRAFQNLVFYKLFIRKYDPDLVIFYSNVNDGTLLKGPFTYRELFLQRTGVDISRLFIDEFEFPKKQAAVHKIQSNLQQLRAYNAMVLWIRDMRRHLPENMRQKLVKDINPPEDFEKDLEDFAIIAKKDNVKLLFVDAFQDYVDRAPEDARKTEVRRIMDGVSQRMGVPFVSAYKKMVIIPDRSKLVFQEDPTHINAAGHLHVTKLIFDALEEFKLLAPRE